MNITKLKRCLKIYDKNKSSYPRITVMCFAFKGKTMICSGINSDKTDPIQSKYRKKVIVNDKYVDKRHAEVDTLKKLQNMPDMDFKEITLFIISKKANGEFRNSKPCPTCRKFIDSLGVGEIVYIYNNKLVSEKILS